MTLKTFIRKNRLINIAPEHCFDLTLHAFFISNTFISNTRLKFAKSQAKAKQHPKAELLPLENYSHSSSSLSYKNNRTYSKIKFMRLYD